ncbi:MAG TPA: PEGA domain-containing protein [Anaeromyxobacteraceae bacterium]|nr:PEGA domain-containing protein [Anaeromyxobacteraceae bacterium]
MASRTTRRPATAALAAAALSLLGPAAACTRAPAPPAAAAPVPAGPDAGTVFVDLQPPGFEVSVDGVARCRAPCSFRIDPGMHRLSARPSGYLPWQEDVRVEPRAEVRVRASLVGSH